MEHTNAGPKMEGRISAGDLAHVLGIGWRRAKLICASGMLDGHPLDVAKIPAPGGFRYMIARDSLPDHVKGRLTPVHNIAAPAFDAQDFAPRPCSDKERKRREVLQPVLATAPGTRARAAAVATVAAAAGVSTKTLQRWLARHERRGIVGLARKRRYDAGEARVISWRALDDRARTAGLSDQDISALAERIRGHVRGLLAATSASASMTAHASIGFVAQELRAAGVSVSQAELLEVCRPPAAFVRVERQARLVDVHRNDAGRYAAKLEPRIRRDRSDLLPLDVAAADVAHLDILVTRPDGSTATPKLVAFMDAATNRLFCRAFLLPKGEGIRREHVLETFVALCGTWGVPTRLVIDNGSEFAARDLARDLLALKVAVDLDATAEPGVHRTRAYNPQSKVLETLFAIVNAGLLRMLPGYIGGDRMRKKTQNQGREPRPWPGTFADFEAALRQAIAFYHDKPQSRTSHLAGDSPNQRLRKHLATGWQASVLVEPEKLGAVFCKRHRRRVHAGGRFDLDGRSWRADDLMHLAGERVTVHEPLFGDRDRLFVYDDADRELLCEAGPEQVFAWGDPAGAGEQARLSRKLRAKIRQLAAQAGDVDPLLAMAATNAAFGPGPMLPAGDPVEPVPAPRPRQRRSSLDAWKAAPDIRKVGS